MRLLTPVAPLTPHQLGMLSHIKSNRQRALRALRRVQKFTGKPFLIRIK